MISKRIIIGKIFYSINARCTQHKHSQEKFENEIEAKNNDNDN